MRDDEYLFGIHAVASALAQTPDRVDTVWVDAHRSDERIAGIVSAAQTARIKLQQVPRAKLDQMAGGGRHQGVVARYREAALLDEGALANVLAGLPAPAFLLILDGVQDPHNLGACLRSADAAGVQAVIIPKDNAAPVTATVRKVASGAAERVPIVQVTNLVRALKLIKDAGVWLVGTADEARQDVYDVDLRVPLAVVMGGEESGLRRLTREHCDFLARLPMLGSVSSLNVSVATGIVLYEVLRQRRAA